MKKWVQLYLNAQNLSNTRTITMRYGPATPDYAKIYLTGANGVGTATILHLSSFS